MIRDARKHNETVTPNDFAQLFLITSIKTATSPPTSLPGSALNRTATSNESPRPLQPATTRKVSVMRRGLTSAGRYLEKRAVGTRPRSPAPEPTTQTAFSDSSAADTPTFTNPWSKQ